MTRTIADLPGPAGLPLLGNAHQMRADRLHSVSEEWCDQYGPMFRFNLGPRRIVAISDQEVINTILRERPDGYRRWQEIKTILTELGNDGVFSAEGEDWKRQRRLAVTALNSNHLHRYFHIIHTATERLYRRLMQAARNGQTLDIADELTSFSVDVTSALAFGHDLNTLERRDNELQGHIKTLFEAAGRRVVAPFPYWRWGVKLPADRAAERSIAAIHAAVHGFIEQARKRMLERPELREAPENFLESMLAAQETEGTFTDEEVIWNTITFLSAGEDTTAHTMAWTLWFLSTRPEIQALWAQEASEVLGEELYPAGHEIVTSLEYGEAVLRESMRLKAVAAILGVEPIADTTIADTQIPAGTRLLLLTRHAALHGSGADYEPERWLEHSGLATPDQKSFLAFGAGPRFCPGRNLAFLESKTAMAMIARNFEVELDDSRGPVKEQLSFTMVPNGLHLRLRERTRERPVLV
jgi:cytochrome P450